MKVFFHPKSTETCCDNRFEVVVDLPTRPVVGDYIFDVPFLLTQQAEELKKKDFAEYEFACGQYDCEVGRLCFDDCDKVYEVIFKTNDNDEYEMHCHLYDGDMEF